ncbi:MAG: redox-active disulfide protein 2 [Methanohalophilus sp. T328-1]|nr:MAG: redox-active disulfide protein 2 [Methanohalophilus sp. T328-1]
MQSARRPLKLSKRVSEAGIEAEITKVEDINSIMDYGVMVTPAVVVDGDVKIAGKIPSVDDVKEWL